MNCARRAQETLICNNQSSEHHLGMQLRNEILRRIRETNLHEKKNKTKKEHRTKISDMIECVQKSFLFYCNHATC